MISFEDINVLIACEDKQDRFRLFGYFDEKNCDAIYTAKSLDQAMAAIEKNPAINCIIIELSNQWINKPAQINDLRKQIEGAYIIGLITQDVRVGIDAYEKMEEVIDVMIFSPVSVNEIDIRLHKKDSQSHLIEAQQVQNDDELQYYKELYFDASSIPKVLINAKDQSITEYNKAFHELFDSTSNQLLGEKWYAFAKDFSAAEAKDTRTKLNEQGHTHLQLTTQDSQGRKRKINLHLTMGVVDGETIYLGEIENTADTSFYAKVFNHIRKLQNIDFSSPEINTHIASLIEWMGLDYCFIIGKSASGRYDVMIDTFTDEKYPLSFVQCDHEFILRKLKGTRSVEISQSAWRDVPADKFLNQFKTEHFLAYHCFISDKLDELFIAGGQNTKHWDATKLLMSDLADHYNQHLAFKALKKSHETESKHDALTGLINRRYINKEIDHSIFNAQDGDMFAILFIDLDRFKVINDSLGHDIGDEVLLSVSNILMKNIKEYGVCARYAGDEFMMLLNNIESKQIATTVAKRVLKDMIEPIQLSNGSEINLTVSIGISYYPEHGQNRATLIKKADVALYDAKLNGKNRVSIYRKSQKGETAKQKIEMERNLRNAIDQGELHAYYQPKINARTDDIAGFEALIRWVHPDLGLISPGLFIPIAEQSGMITEIGYFMMRRACEDLVGLQKKFGLGLQMSVNLSPLQLNDKNLITEIRNIIQETTIHPKYLDFEVTESEGLINVQSALSAFKQIVELGCSLSIDDFGTGHSSLDYLKKIPAKTLKIDQSFVKNIGLDQDDEAILEATFNMARKVGRQIVAEGVETEEQRLYLMAKGCDYFQGFLFCRPLPIQEITKILKQRASMLKEMNQ